MGDTFQDEWQDQVPEKFEGESGEWQFVGVDNTKWSGNNYQFLLPGTASHIRMWSRHNERMELEGEVIFNGGILNIHLRSFSGNWNKEEKVYTPPIKWTSIQEALTALDKKFKEVQDMAKPLVATLDADKAWEAKDPLE